MRDGRSNPIGVVRTRVNVGYNPVHSTVYYVINPVTLSNIET